MRRFDPPHSDYGAGHRGVDLDARVGAPVRAVNRGVVTHAGVVAGRGTVTVLHPDGLRSTYEPVAVTVAVGDQVEVDQVLGLLEADPGGHCRPGACLHLGALRGTIYLDPEPLLVGPRPVILLPLPGPG